jgi:hypothetical protein
MDKIIRTRSFDFNGKKYETKAYLEIDEIHVRVFLGDNPTSPYRYMVGFDTKMDFEKVHGDVIEELMNLAEQSAKNFL